MEDQMFQHFLKKRNRMSGKTMQRERKISSKLVHIEQVIDLALYMIVIHVYLLCLLVYSDIYNNLLSIMK
jgi:hypothetical protein